MAVEDLYKKACDAVEKGNYDYSVALFREVLRAEPEFPKARMALRVCERRREAERGTGALARMLRYVKRLPALIRGGMLGSKPDKALEAYETFLMDNPSNVGGLIKAGAAARKAGLTQASIDIYKDAHTLAPTNKNALRALNELYEEIGEREEALKSMERLIGLEPENQDLQHRYKNLQALEHMQKHGMDQSTMGKEGDFRKMLKDQDEASRLEKEQQFSSKSTLDVDIEKAVESLAADPENPNKIVRLGKLYQQHEDYAKGQELLKKALKEHPDNFIIRECYGDLLFEVFEDRIRKIDAKLKENPLKVELKQEKAELVRKKKRFKIQEFEWRIQQHPTDFALKQKLGHSYFDVENIDDAIKNFQQASQDPRQMVQASTMLGECFVRKKQFDLAAQQFMRALERNPSMNETGKELHYKLADAYEKAGKADQALEEYKKIYSVDIGFRDVSQKVESLGTA